jgi:hypothetical protein
LDQKIAQGVTRPKSPSPGRCAGGSLVAVEPKKPKSRPLGFARGEVWVADDFDAPLPDELLAEFYGGTVPKAIEPPRRKRK